MTQSLKVSKFAGFAAIAAVINSIIFLVAKATDATRKIAEAAIPLQSKEINHCFSQVLTQAQMKTLIEISTAISMHMKEHHPLNKKENTYDAVA